MVNELFQICCQRDPDPQIQRREIEAAIQGGIDVNQTDKNGVTALHHAVRFRNPAAVKALIQHGADVNLACRRNGSTPLHRAVTHTGAPGTSGRCAEAEAIIALLLAAGADRARANKAGKTPLDYVSDDRLRAQFGRQLEDNAP
jgi:tankyrase